MPYEISYFRAIHGSTGCTSEKEVKVEEIRRRFSRDFDTSINVVYDAGRNNGLQDFIITPTKEKNTCSIFTRPGEMLNIGDIIFWNKLHWLVIDKDFQNEIYNSGTIIRCNRMISWQNPKTKTIHSRWCLCYNPYSSNIDEDKIVSTLNGKYEVKVPMDTETMQVGTGRRFLLDIVDDVPMAYRLTFPDVDSNKYKDIDGGFIVWNLVSDLYDKSRDNRDLMIADYVAAEIPPSPPPVDPTLLKCSITGRTDIKVGGSTRKYTAHFYTADGITEITDGSVVAAWEFIPDPAHAANFITVPNGNSISVSVPENDVAIGQKAMLVLKDTAGLYHPAQVQVEAVVM